MSCLMSRLCLRVLVFLVVHPDATMESGKMEDNFTVSVLALPKFGNLSAPSLEGESVFTGSLVEPAMASGWSSVRSLRLYLLLLVGLPMDFARSWALPMQDMPSAAFSTLSAYGSLVSFGDLVPCKERIKVMCRIRWLRFLMAPFLRLATSALATRFPNPRISLCWVALLWAVRGPSSSRDCLPHHFGAIAFYAVRRSGAFCVGVRGCLELAAACVTMVRASTCSMGFFSSLQVWISGFSIVCEEVWFLISAEAAAAWSCPEFHLLSLARALAVDEVLHLVLVSFVIGATWSLGTTTLSKGSSCAATAAATPRVDVEKTPQAAAAPKYLLASSGHVWTEFGGLLGPSEKLQRVEVEGKHGGGKREKMDSFVVFVVSLGGSTVQVRVEGKDSYESLAAKVAAKVNIPACHWYLMLCPPPCSTVTPLFLCNQDS